MLDGLFRGVAARSGPDDGRPPPDRVENLFHPGDAERDRGAHGTFDTRAHRWSPQLTAVMHPGWLMIGAGVIGALTAIRPRS